MYSGRGDEGVWERIESVLHFQAFISNRINSINLRHYNITIEQNYVVDNILEEWLAKWLANQGIENVHHKKQSSPDFWLDKEQTNDGWLEVKSFIGSPNFDIGSFRSYINEIIDCPWKLHTKYLLIKYKMEENGGLVVIENFWLNNQL